MSNYAMAGDQLVANQQNEIVALKNELRARDSKIAELSALLDKYQSVFSGQKPKIDWKREKTDTGETKGRKRGIGISAEPENEQQIEKHELKRHPKPGDVRSLIKQALMENEFMNKLAHDEVSNLIDCMFPIAHKAGETLIQEGEFGNMVYVLYDGKLEIWKDNAKMREIGSCTVLGELAILYNCKRTATVKAMTDCQLWAIDRQSFQTILRKRNIQRHKSRVQFLKSVPLFQKLPETTLSQIADHLSEVQYQPNEYVIRQGAQGDNFFIVSQGTVVVTINKTHASGELDLSSEPTYVRTLSRGEWFGERALKGDHKRTANIMASEKDGVTCLTLDLDSYNLLIRDMTNTERQYWEEKMRQTENSQSRQEFQSLKLSDLDYHGTLGVGGFGRVQLVSLKDDPKKSFALKQMKKVHLVRTKQQEHVMSERRILFESESDYIVKLWKTFRDRKFVYMMLEVCLGGELWTLLRDQYFFAENATQFYVACVVEALDYLHKKGIVFRDLKPENLMLDINGYCKLTDFGFAKRMLLGEKTWTFCGTPEYMAPEIILNKGHDFAVDFWSLGILIFELLSGLPPFDTPDSMRTYSMILKGIDAIGFPPKVTRNAQNLIKKLCRCGWDGKRFCSWHTDNASERIGYGKGGIRAMEKHVWFEGFNWIGLQRKTLRAPHSRPVNTGLDMRNFDKCADDREETPDEMSGWDVDF